MAKKDDNQSAKFYTALKVAAAISTVIAGIASMPTVSKMAKNIWDGEPFNTPAPIECENYLEESHENFSKQPNVAPDAELVELGRTTRNSNYPGRVDVTFSWLNPASTRHAVIAIQGPYGAKNEQDQNATLVQPYADQGDCYNWFAVRTQNSFQTDAVTVEIEGLWPNQNYCYYAAYRERFPAEAPADASETEFAMNGWSQPTPQHCFVLEWNDKWGDPAYPDS